MKTFLIVSCLLAAAAAISTENRDKLTEAWKDPLLKCSEENGFTGLTLQEIYEKEQRDGVAKSTCLHACLLRSLGVLTFLGIDGRKLGKSVESVFAGQPEVITELTEAAIHCVPKVATVQDECKKAYLYSQCYLHSN